MNDTLRVKITPDTFVGKFSTDYSDGDLLIIDDIRDLPTGRQLQIDMVVLLICVGGSARFEIGQVTHTLQAHQMAVVPPNVLVANYAISSDFSSKIIGLSYPALQRMLHVNREIWELITAVTADPVFDIDPHMRRLMMHYYALLKFKLAQPANEYTRPTMHALFQAIFYDLFEIVKSRRTTSTEATATRHADLLVNRFLRMLADGQGEQRSVAYYAQQLCVSAKHLSSMCKKTTGRTAKEWIRSYTIEILRHQLRATDRPIKEIAYMMGFPSLSVFGKFVRSTLGTSPTAYRANKQSLKTHHIN